MSDSTDKRAIDYVVDRLTSYFDWASSGSDANLKDLAVDVRALMGEFAAVEAELADQYVSIRAYAPAYLNKRVDQYRTRTHAGAEKVEQAIEHLEQGEPNQGMDALREALNILEGNA